MNRVFDHMDDGSASALPFFAGTDVGGVPIGRSLDVTLPVFDLQGILTVPGNPKAAVLFAHGSGSSRFSERNTFVSNALNRMGIATLLFDLLSEREEGNRRNVFDIPMLAERLIHAVEWISSQHGVENLPIGLFGASTGAAAALVAAAYLGDAVSAVVSRGGRPDLANASLDDVRAPTLLLVGGADVDVLALNRLAFDRLRCPKSLRIVPGASHRFPEPGALEAVTDEASEWFARYLLQR